MAGLLAGTASVLSWVAAAWVSRVVEHRLFVDYVPFCMEEVWGGKYIDIQSCSIYMQFFG
jgi:hypothetical protein